MTGDQVFLLVAFVVAVFFCVRCYRAAPFWSGYCACAAWLFLIGLLFGIDATKGLF